MSLGRTSLLKEGTDLKVLQSMKERTRCPVKNWKISSVTAKCKKGDWGTEEDEEGIFFSTDRDKKIYMIENGSRLCHRVNHVWEDYEDTYFFKAVISVCVCVLMNSCLL